MSAFPRRGAQMRGVRAWGLSTGVPRPARDGPYMVGRFSKPTPAPFGGQPPKSNPFSVYFLNSIDISYFLFFDSTLAHLLTLGADFLKSKPFTNGLGQTRPKWISERFERPGPKFGQSRPFLD